jgi:hypothetical protein
MKQLAVFLLMFAALNVSAQPAQSPLGPERAKSIPIADAHFHVMQFMDPKTLIEMMDTQGIKWAGGAGVEGATPERVAEVSSARVLRGRQFFSKVAYRACNVNG